VSSSYTTLIQITDTHIFDEEDGELGGVNTRNSLQQVLQEISDKYSDSALLILTGDNTHESSKKAYKTLKGMLDEMPMPYTFLPGNHDHEENYQVLTDNEDSDEGAELDKWLTVGNWNLLLLDSHVEHEVNGLLSDEELDFSEQMLSYSSEPVMAFVHHHLLPIGCDWLDRQRIANADKLFDIVKDSQVKAIFNGHVHQEWQGAHQGAALYSTPSTCMQFKPNSDNYAEDPIAPGFRWIKLYDDGHFETEVVRV